MDKPPSTEDYPPEPDPPAPPGLDLTGRTLGDYQVLRRLGQGGMGQVFLAEQISLKRKVALKILKPELAADPVALERFKVEAKAVAQATHANIVQVYATGEAEGVWYIALEYVEGRNLREYLVRKGPPELPLALNIMRQVASALQRASELGIIHRDVKPENILLTRKAEVKVADFGLSRCLNSAKKPALNLTASGVTMGTPLYMSPEQVEGKPLDCRTDIYSFGVTCYHMLAGHPPYEGGSAFEVALQHVKGTPKPLAEIRPDLPSGLSAIVHKMMAVDPAQRHQTGRELLRDLARLREGLIGAPITATEPHEVALDLGPITPPENPTLPSLVVAGADPSATPRRGWLLALFVLTVVLAVFGGIGAAWLRRQGQAAPPPENGKETDTEKSLSNLVDTYLKPDKPRTDEDFGLKLCQQLAVFYFNDNRLDDADGLFQRLQKHASTRYQYLGNLGQAVSLGLRNDPAKAKESNERFRNLPPIAPPRLPPDPRRPPDAELLKLYQNPLFREHLSRALRNNVRNGVAEKDVPETLRPFLREKGMGRP